MSLREKTELTGNLYHSLSENPSNFNAQLEIINCTHLWRPIKIQANKYAASQSDMIWWEKWGNVWGNDTKGVVSWGTGEHLGLDAHSGDEGMWLDIMVLCVTVMLPGHTWVMPRAHTGLCMEEVDLALLRGSLLCKEGKEETIYLGCILCWLAWCDIGMKCTFLLITLLGNRELWMAWIN